MRRHFGEVLESYDQALAFIHANARKISPGSRLTYYRDLLARYTHSTDSFGLRHELHRLALALREIDEIVEITTTLRAGATDGELALLGRLTGGAALWDRELRRSVRDIQYELWLLAQFRTHDLQASLGEPDLWISWQERSYPIAAKRPRNLNSIDGSIRAGLSQLDPYREGGILALSLDLFLLPPDKFLIEPSPGEVAGVMDALFPHFTNWLAHKRGPLNRRAIGRNAIAFFLTGALPVFAGETGTCCLETRTHVLCLKNDARVRDLEGFIAAFQFREGGRLPVPLP